MPEQRLSRQSYDALIVHLCRFAVRALYNYLAAFLVSVNSCASLLFSLPFITRSYAKQRTSLLFPTRDLDALLHPCAHTILLRPCLDSLALFSGTGISTSFPSATTFVLTLGPDLLWVVKPSPENLGHSTALFLQRSRYSCRHSLFCAVH